ncbi:bifunctional nicotinamidase/pyrazinamidase [Agrobacterium rubi]|nr:bifunctional nicotinamidase/pyrazinamidase [Agrobacterium rubi]NTF23850.1 bifunctional nicotinamidase/pyrazinamidase [Agrobacterium rubi]
MTEQPRKRALLLVDIQNGFCPGGNLAVDEGDQIVPVANALISSGYYDIIVASQDWHPAGHGSFASTHGKAPFEMGELGGQPQVMWPDHCVQGSKDAEFHPDLDMTKVVHIQQKGQDPSVDSYSAFRDNAENTKTGLADWLSGQGIYLLDVCGLATDYCVKFSALDARSMLPGITVRYIDDASRGITAEGVREAKKEMTKAGIEIVESASITSPFAHRAEYGFGENFHTALRKGVDTKWSVVLWQYLNQMERLEEDEKASKRVWPHFVKHCSRFWVSGLKPSEAAKKWAAMHKDRNTPEEDLLPYSGVAVTLSTMIELCDALTWKELDSTVEYWVDLPEEERKKAVATNG